MDNLFSTLDQTEENLFSNVAAPGQPPKALPDDEAARLAQMAAIQRMDPMADAVEMYQQLEADTEAMTDMVQRGEEDRLRIQAAADEQVRDLRGLSDLIAEAPKYDPTGELLKGSAMAAQYALERDIETRKETAFEKRTVEQIQNLAAAGDITQAKLLLNNLEHGSANDVIRDTNIKRMILAREVQRAQVAKEDQPWIMDAVDFIASMVPFNASLSNAENIDVKDGMKRWYDFIASGERLRNESDTLWNTDPATFARLVREQLIPGVKENSTFFGYHNKTEELNLLTSMEDTPQAWETNTFELIDNLGVVPLTKIGKAVTIPSMLVRNGARKEMTAAVANAMKLTGEEGVEAALKKTGITEGEIIDNVLPQAVNPGSAASKVSVGPDVLALLERQDRVLRELLPGLQQPGRFVGDEEKTAVEAFLKRMEQEVGAEIKDVRVDTQLSDGSKVIQTDIIVGKQSGGGYADAKSAKRAAMSQGYGAADVISDESGQWFWKVRRAIPETGFYTSPLDVKATNMVSRFVLNSRLLGDEFLANIAQRSGNTHNKVTKAIVEQWADKFQALKNHERDSLHAILANGENAGKWFDDNELDVLYNRAFKRSPSEREIEAYHTAIQVNDFEFALRNDNVYKENLVKGFETVYSDTGHGVLDRVNAIVDREISNPPKGRVYDVSAKQHIHEPDWDSLRAKGYILVRPQQAMKMADETKSAFFVGRKEDFVIEALRRDQLAYRAGGHRMYKGKYFSKQAVVGLQGDTGREYLDNPNTYMVGETKAEVDFWNSVMEEARLAYLDGATADDINRIFGDLKGFGTGDEFIENMRKGVYESNQKFETVYDREMPKVYGERFDENYVDPDESGYEGFLRSTGRMYYSGKGEHLPDWQGSMGTTLDPFQTINQSLKSVASLSSFSDYKLTSVSRWVNTYKKYLDYPEGASDMKIFQEGKLRATSIEGRERIKQGMEAQREIIERNLGWKTDGVRTQEAFTRQVSEWIGGKDTSRLPNGLRQKMSAGITDWVGEKNPFNFLRGWAFDMKLGLFNIGQLPLQAATIFASTALSPKHGMHAIYGWKAVRGYLYHRNEEVLETWVKNGYHTRTGFTDPKEFKDMVRYAERSGFLDVGGTHQMVNSYGPSVATSEFGDAAQSFRQHGRFFFYEAEVTNRTVAWQIAWKETKAALPGVDYKSAKFQNMLAGKAEDYSLSMSRQSEAAWQQGLLSIPTQFWAYNVRMMEAMLPSALGGGKQFTAAQKWRLFLSQTVLYGAAATPATAALSEFIKGKTGGAADIDTLYGKMDRGFFDTAWHEITGGDVLIGDRLGTGGWLPQTIKDLLGTSQFGEKSTAEFLGGATFSISGTVLGDLKNVATYALAEGGGLNSPLTRNALTKLSANISTVGNGMKAYLVYKYGTYSSNKGTTVVNDLPSSAAFAAMIGLQPGETDDLGAMSAYFKDEKKAVDEAAKVIANYRVKMLNEEENVAELAEQVNLFTKMLPPHIRRKALDQVPDVVQPSLYNAYADRRQREWANKELIKRMEQE